MKAETKALATQGLAAGLIGYATVVVFFAIVNLIAGHPLFYTPATLGTALFEGAGPGPGDATGPIAIYNMLHLLFFLAAGQFAVFLVRETERFPVLWYLGFLALVVVGGWALMALFFFAVPLFGGAWWQIAVASLLAAGFMGSYLLWRHPLLRRELKEIQHSDAMA
jgi:hypothetical protein